MPTRDSRLLTRQSGHQYSQPPGSERKMDGRPHRNFAVHLNGRVLVAGDGDRRNLQVVDVGHLLRLAEQESLQIPDQVQVTLVSKHQQIEQTVAIMRLRKNAKRTA